MTLTERLRSTPANLTYPNPDDDKWQVMAGLLCREAADEIDRLTAENAALRDERDALAATCSEAAEMIRRCDYTPARSALLQATKGSTAILAARDARVKAEALRDAAFNGPFKSDADKWIATELRRMADAIEKESK